MSLWSDTPRIQGPPDTQDVGQILAYVKDLANTVAKMAKDLEFLVNGNLDANNIRANSIETKNLKANSITAEKIQAGAVTAEKISVNELSAISANLGHIVAGLIESVQIFGSYIATRRGSFPRAEMSNAENLFGAYADNNRYVKIVPLNSLTNAPQVIISSPSGNLNFYQVNTVSYLLGYNSDMIIQADRDISIIPGSFYNVRIPFDSLLDSGSGTSLYQQLLSKASRGVETGRSGSANGGIPIGTRLVTADGGYVTWNGIPEHSHTQS